MAASEPGKVGEKAPEQQETPPVAAVVSDKAAATETKGGEAR